MKEYEILGIGCPFVDLIVHIQDDFLRYVPGAKGGMVVVDYKTLKSILDHSSEKPVVAPGGSGANTIRGLARLGHACALVGKIGGDAAGKKFKDGLIALNIVPFLLNSPTPTAQALCLITPDGERTMRSFMGAGTEMRASDLDPAFFRGAKLVHIEGYSLLNESLTQRAMELAKEAGAKVSFDLGSFEVVKMFKDTIIHLVSKYVDILFGNRDEMHTLTNLNPEKACDVLRDICETAVILLGGDGCVVGSGSQKIKVPAQAVPVIDTTGAGDLFVSGFLHGYLHKRPLEECAKIGTLTGAAVVQVRGVDISPEEWASIKQKTQALKGT